jgi:hypothetical protein
VLLEGHDRLSYHDDIIYRKFRSPLIVVNVFLSDPPLGGLRVKASPCAHHFSRSLSIRWLVQREDEEGAAGLFQSTPSGEKGMNPNTPFLILLATDCFPWRTSPYSRRV